MLAINYCYRIYPDITQQQRLIEWMETCRGAYNYGLREILKIGATVANV